MGDFQLRGFNRNIALGGSIRSTASGRKPTQEKELRPCSITPSKLLTQF